jgi:hypothetical protein
MQDSRDSEHLCDPIHLYESGNMTLRRTLVWRMNNAGIYNRASNRSTITDNHRPPKTVPAGIRCVYPDAPNRSGRTAQRRGGRKPPTIRRRLLAAAKVMQIPLIIKRSGNDLYFWRENGEAAQKSTKRRYNRRGKAQEETPTPDQPVDELGMVGQGIPAERQTFPAEESPELGQTPI